LLNDELKQALERELEAAKSRREMHERAAAEARGDEERATAELHGLAGDAIERRPRGGPDVETRG
jgi:hypothetical protein